jgi:hypothetical protein
MGVPWLTNDREKDINARVSEFAKAFLSEILMCGLNTGSVAESMKPFFSKWRYTYSRA